MATSRFMKVAGATGESPISGHEQESEVIAFSWGVIHPASVQSGTGGSAGRTTFTDFTCTCYMDNAYPSIVKFCAGGKSISEVKITALKMTGDAGETFMTWTFSDVMCTAITNSGNAEAQDVITYSFQASKMKMEYKPQQTSGGTLGGANEATWDVKKNTP